MDERIEKALEEMSKLIGEAMDLKRSAETGAQEQYFEGMITSGLRCKSILDEVAKDIEHEEAWRAVSESR